MRSLNALAAALAVLVLAACADLMPASAPSHPPATDLKADTPDDRGSFYMSPGQTLLLEALKNASSRDPAVLAVVGHYTNATLFKAGAVGRTTATAYYDEGSCSHGCNAHAAYMIAVVVVSDLQHGVVVSEQDLPWIAHLRVRQPFVVALQNRPGSAPWARLTIQAPVADRCPRTGVIRDFISLRGPLLQERRFCRP